jgi:predicted small secreted protein
MRRLVPLLPLVIATLVAGCGTATGSGEPAASWAEPSAAADPVATVQEATDRSLSSSVTLNAAIKVGGTSFTLNGKADPATKTLQVSGKAPEPIEIRVIGDTVYLKMDSLSTGKAWTKIDVNKLRPTSSLRQSFDLQAQTGIVGGIVTAEDLGKGNYRGTADLEKAARSVAGNKGMVDGLRSTAKLAKDPKAIPFEATVDAEGRLTTLSYSVATKELGNLTTDLKMSDFGKPVKVTAPAAGQVEEAPEELYRFM